MIAEIKQDLPRKICPNCRREFQSSALTRKCPFDDSLLAPLIKDELIGTTIDARLQIIERVSEGGWGCVYRAYHKSLNQTVAVKVLHSEYIGDLDKVARFQREAKAISGLVHDRVVKIYDYGMLANGRPYLVMEYIKGESLLALTGERHELNLPTVLDIFMQACDALGAAHRKGIVHRDIKPGNIMLMPDGVLNYKVKVLDFGLAQVASSDRTLTKSGETIGSPSYMSPEQCRGTRLDGRSDIYSLGCVLYEVLTGERPVVGTTTVDCMSKHLFLTPKPFSKTPYGKSYPRIVEKVVMKCLSKDPMGRYQTMEDLRAALREAMLVGMGGVVPYEYSSEISKFGKLFLRAAEETCKACLFMVEMARVFSDR
jgi:serine/threonine protein kinase